MIQFAEAVDVPFCRDYLVAKRGNHAILAPSPEY